MNTVRQIRSWTHQIHMPGLVHSKTFTGIERILTNKYFWLTMAAALFIAFLILLAIFAPQGDPQMRPSPFGPFPYVP